jgi:hypothetical protein
VISADGTSLRCSIDRVYEALEGFADRHVELVQRAAVGGGHQVNARADVGDVVEVLRPAAVDVEKGELPLDLVEDRRAELREQSLIAVRRTLL